MSYEKIAKVMCDGPNCRREVFGDTVAEARRYAKYGQMWFWTAKYGLDLCSEQCNDNWHKEDNRKRAEAEQAADAPAGTLDQGTVKV